MKAKPKVKPKTKPKAGRVVLDRIDRALDLARHRLFSDRILDAEMAYAMAVTHSVPACCRKAAGFGIVGNCCDGGCLTERPEVEWAALLDLHLAHASADLARGK